MNKNLMILAGLVAGGIGQAASAAVLFDSHGFEAPFYATGNLVGQNGWLVDNNPPGPFTVENTFAQAGTQAARATGGGTGTNWTFPDLSYTPAPGEIITIHADLARTLGTTASFGYLIDIYAPTGRIARAGLGNNAGQIVPLVTTLNSTGAPANFLVNNETYQANQWVSFDIALNFAAQTFDLSVNGGPALTGLPFVGAGTSLADADFQVSTAAGANDVGYLDNYLVQTVPTPGALALLGLGGLAARRRR
ncbi:MAG: hypothetical protein GC200_00350 [Tepidisphaera sp.]|nr:hypothetical protein [Tepidisphaera sp.]